MFTRIVNGHCGGWDGANVVQDNRLTRRMFVVGGSGDTIGFTLTDPRTVDGVEKTRGHYVTRKLWSEDTRAGLHERMQAAGLCKLCGGTIRVALEWTRDTPEGETVYIAREPGGTYRGSVTRVGGGFGS